MLKRTLLAIAATSLLAACATQPMGPTVQVMPSANKPFQVFQQDEEQCKQYAQSQIAGQVDAANNKAVGEAAVGTLLGAALGAAVGNHQGAGIGAAGGAIIGTSAGADSSHHAQHSIQQQYNNAYVQCMYSRGNQVPGTYAPAAAVTPPPPPMAPPPPSGMAPPPGYGAPEPAMTVAQAQERLYVLGYSNERVNGLMGPQTRIALREYQKDRGLPVTGELDADTIAQLRR
jgi:outer membrane lipoprotein SlyB